MEYNLYEVGINFSHEDKYKIFVQKLLFCLTDNKLASRRVIMMMNDGENLLLISSKRTWDERETTIKSANANKPVRTLKEQYQQK